MHTYYIHKWVYIKLRVRQCLCVKIYGSKKIKKTGLRTSLENVDKVQMYLLFVLFV